MCNLQLSRGVLAAILVLVAGLAGMPARAAQPLPAGQAAGDEPAAASAWGYNLWKTVTYETAASLDAFVFGLWFGETAAGGLGFGAANFLLAGTLDHSHEMLWNAFGPDPNTADAASLGLVKTLSYRVVSTARVLTTSLLFSGSAVAAGGYAIANNLIDATIYFVNDLAWARFGPAVDYLGAEPVPGKPVPPLAAAQAPGR